jgi:hypothetical protein
MGNIDFGEEGFKNSEWGRVGNEDFDKKGSFKISAGKDGNKCLNFENCCRGGLTAP